MIIKEPFINSPAKNRMRSKNNLKSTQERIPPSGKDPTLLKQEREKKKEHYNQKIEIKTQITEKYETEQKNQKNNLLES